jgi:subtilisin family serine protease
MSRRAHRGFRPRPSGWTWLLPVAALVAAGCQDEPLPTEPGPAPGADLSASAQSGVGADDWIVVFRDGTGDPPGLARRLASDHGATLRFVYTHALRGFAAAIPPQAVDALRANPNVDYVERDGVVTKVAVGSWGLDRIDQRALPLDGVYAPTGDGTGVDAWIIDTGIDYGRTDEFGARFDLARDADFVDGDDDASDCDGHGTHVAGTVGSVTYGVAKDVTLIGVRVLDCTGSGSYAGVIAGIDHVVANMDGPTVANMSLGGGYSSSLNAAVANAVSAGVVMAVAAGNNNGADACNYSPASAPAAITVASSTSSDARSSFSNVGSCVDLFAPGSAITSTVMGSGTGTWSGTSMATPHVTGAAALMLEADPGLSPAGVWSAMQGGATSGVISGTNGSPNLLLYVGTGGGDPDPGCGAECPDATIQWVSDVSVTPVNGNRAKGAVIVQVVDPDGPLGGATVTGTWTVNGVQNYATSTGTTGSDGTVELSTGTLRGASTFAFCVTGVSADGHEDGSAGECSPFGAPYDGGGGTEPPPPPPPPAGAPTELTAASVLRGVWRAELAWTGGAALVDVRRNGGVIAAGLANSGVYTDNLGKTPTGTYTYQVCNAGSTTDCSGMAAVGF